MTTIPNSQREREREQGEGVWGSLVGLALAVSVTAAVLVVTNREGEPLPDISARRPATVARPNAAVQGLLEMAAPASHSPEPLAAWVFLVDSCHQEREVAARMAGLNDQRVTLWLPPHPYRVITSPHRADEAIEHLLDEQLLRAENGAPSLHIFDLRSGSYVAGMQC